MYCFFKLLNCRTLINKTFALIVFLAEISEKGFYEHHNNSKVTRHCQWAEQLYHKNGTIDQITAKLKRKDIKIYSFCPPNSMCRKGNERAGNRSIAIKSKLLLLLQFLYVTCCYIRMYMVYNNMVSWVTAAHYCCFNLE